jgi:hypothetical protein
MSLREALITKLKSMGYPEQGSVSASKFVDKPFFAQRKTPDA